MNMYPPSICDTKKQEEGNFSRVKLDLNSISLNIQAGWSKLLSIIIYYLTIHPYIYHHRLNEAAELSSYCALHALPLSVPLQAWLGIGTWHWPPKSPSKLICVTSADDNIFMLWTQLTNSLQGIIRGSKNKKTSLWTWPVQSTSLQLLYKKGRLWPLILWHMSPQTVTRVTQLFLFPTSFLIKTIKKNLTKNFSWK